MSIRESALTAITSITNSDFVRAVTSAGASRKVTIGNIGKHILGKVPMDTSITPTSGSAQEAINTLKDTISTDDVATLMNGTVPSSGSTSWNTTVTGNISLSSYNWLYIQAGVASAVYHTQMIYIPAMIKSGDSSYTSVYWNDGNRVSVQISATGSVTVSTKTQNYGGIYIVKGIK